jgi:hypothetical protein
MLADRVCLLPQEQIVPEIITLRDELRLKKNLPQY